MQLGLRPRLKARPSLVDLLRRSRQQEQGHLESHSELAVPSVNSTAASSHSPPPEQAPQSAPPANQELPPGPLAFEAQRIASTYQLPSSPFQLQPPSTPPLSLHSVLHQEPDLPIPFQPHSEGSQLDGPAAESTAPPKMASVSFAYFSILPHLRQASSWCMLHAACHPAAP
jgi:V-type H+-transporting ATPase subunit A